MLHATPPRGAHPSAWPRRSRRDLDEGPATHLLDLPPWAASNSSVTDARRTRQHMVRRRPCPHERDDRQTDDEPSEATDGETRGEGEHRGRRPHLDRSVLDTSSTHLTGGDRDRNPDADGDRTAPPVVTGRECDERRGTDPRAHPRHRHPERHPGTHDHCAGHIEPRSSQRRDRPHDDGEEQDPAYVPTATRHEIGGERPHLGPAAAWPALDDSVEHASSHSTGGTPRGSRRGADRSRVHRRRQRRLHRPPHWTGGGRRSPRCSLARRAHRRRGREAFPAGARRDAM